MDGKVYIFVSHSHFDIDKVRVIRNYLEDIGCEPILFFLKSKTDKNEITQLIKDEIDARLWFVYCQSENSKNSNWVATELKYIEETNKKNNFTIELNSAFDKYGVLLDSVKSEIRKHLNIIKNNQTVFISYSRKDAILVDRIKEYMNKLGINFKDSINVASLGENWMQSITNEIVSSEYFLVFITENSISSEWIKKEIDYAMSNNKKILPVVLDYNIFNKFNFEDYSYNLAQISSFFFDINNINKSCIDLMYYIISLQE
ncbi:MAG: toll/interleukin-1 receptor domain-containing protein [Acholeplasmatales bacterium]|nr:toll/interleukin-1 receptor domain-containing protein [Acholeplasmatales bacterium]